MSSISHATSGDENLSAAKRALLERWRRGASTHNNNNESELRLTAEHMDGPQPLSFGQQRLWFLEQLDAQSSSAYVIRSAVRLQGPLDVNALRQSVQALIQRHEVLRTRFLLVDGVPMQQVQPTLDLPLRVVDWRSFSPQQQEAMLPSLLTQMSREPCILSEGPLWRLLLLQLDEQTHVLSLTIHHIIADGWSLEIFFRDLAHGYQAAQQEGVEPLSPLPIQYGDYARWQRAWLSGRRREEHLNYWQEQLRGAPEVLELPTDRPRPAVQRFEGAIYQFSIADELVEQLRVLGQQEGCTLFMTLLAAFNCLLYRYTGQEDLVIGTDSMNRNRIELEDVIGFFVNQLVIRTNLSDHLTFRDLLQRERSVVLDAYKHQDFPFEQLVDALQIRRDLSYNPVFQVLFSLENKLSHEYKLGTLAMEPLDVDNGSAQFDLSFLVRDWGKEVSGVIEYNTDLFERATIETFAKHFLVVLQQMCDSTDQPITAFSLLTLQEQQQRQLWNNTHASFPDDVSFYALFQEQAARTPNAVAVACGSASLTYAQLQRQANGLATQLVDNGIGPELVVAIMADRGIPFIVSMLAIMQAGGAYLPLDPQYPDPRLVHMLVQSRAAYALVGTAYEERFAKIIAKVGNDKLTVASLEQALTQATLRESRQLSSPAKAHNLAYVIYTSGSTGVPKGAMIEHIGMLNHLYAKVADLKLCENDNIAQTASMSFDISVWQSLAALVVGGTVHILPDEVSHDPVLLLQEVENRHISILETVPALLRLIVEETANRGSKRPPLAALRWLILTGEALPADFCQRWFSIYPHIPLLNAYGPTECSDDVTHYALTKLETYAEPYLPIGKPVANTDIYLLDDHFNPVPVNVAGQIYVGGVGVGRGYLNEAGKTAQVFIPHPFSQEPGARLYRTGDLARYHDDGTIAFLTRVDHQVKIRGFRIELGEIEAAINQHPAVRDCVVVAQENHPVEKRLIAYLVCNEERRVLASEIRQYLAGRLPDYMLPAAIVFLERLPTTQNGKIDRRALPVPDITRVVEGAYVAPRTSEEKALADIWAQVLGREQVGIHDNFFALGGDSILSIQIVSRAHEAGLQVTPRQIFQHQTVAQLALVTTPIKQQQVQQEDVSGVVPLTPIQSWFLARNFTQMDQWNQDVLLEVKSSLDVAVLRQALMQLIAQHDALRLRFIAVAEGWSQFYAPLEESNHFVLRNVDLSSIPNQELARCIEETCSEAQTSLNLAHGPLLSVTWMDCGPTRSGRLLLVIHHLVVDGVSWRILLEDLHTLYQQISRQETTRLPAKTTSFKYWAETLHSYARTPQLEQERSFWLQLPWQQVKQLPRDLQGGNREADAHTYSASLTESETLALLQSVPAIYHTQITEVLLTALGRALLPWIGGQSLFIELEGHGREDLFSEVNLTRTVGWFTTLYPLILTGIAGQSIGQALKNVKEQIRAIPQRGIGYGLLREIGNDPALRALPEAEISFNYLGQYDQDLSEMELFTLAREASGPPRSLQAERSHIFDIITRVASGRFQVIWDYSAGLHKSATIEYLAQAYLAALREIIAHCQQPNAGGFTPSDFPAARLNQKNLDKIMNTIQRRGRQA